MIDRTILLIDRLAEYHEREKERRHARRNHLHRIDGLLNRFELLNLREVDTTPRALARQAFGLAHEDDHPLLRRPLRGVTIAQWMDTLYDLQDPLLFGSEYVDDTGHPE